MFFFIYRIYCNETMDNKNKKNKNYITSSSFCKIVLISLLYIFFTWKDNFLESELNKSSLNLNYNSTIAFILNHQRKNKPFFLNISHIKASNSLKFNIVQIEYFIYIFDEDKALVKPFDLSFHYDLHIFCSMKIVNESVGIISFPAFYENKNLICIDNFQPNKKVELGIKIFQKNERMEQLIFQYNFFSFNSFDLNDLKNINELNYSIDFINNEYTNLINEMNENKSLFTLKASYIQKPSFYTLSSRENENNKWLFKNIYNHYFCFCKGLYCEREKIKASFQECKYYYYLTIIDNFRNLFKKTEYLLADFILPFFNADDILPIFKQMIKQNISAHYMTPKDDIYNEYCHSNKRCWVIIRENFINGDFLEKYLNLILRLKVAVAGADFYAINNLFYNIEYITSINIGHGVKFFKSFLYKDYTSPKKYNKLVLTPSSKIISVAKKFGWKDENIIKICLPKWDKYNNLIKLENNQEKSIFIFFTWREIISNKKKDEGILRLSRYYVDNIIQLLNNTELNYELKKHNITLFFGLHQNSMPIKEYITRHFKFVKIIQNQMISNCLIKSSLIVTDFSSVVFDFIYQKKPIIIYIPDYGDPMIKDLYSENYYNLIKSLGNGTIKFENQFYNTKDVVDKIIFYINNNFKLEQKLQKFFDSFEFKCEKNNIQIFIDYIKSII